MPSIFSKIVKNELNCFKVFEDKNHLAFLDIRPNTRGHTLCIPKKENDYIYIEKEEVHRLENEANTNAELIEIQYGDYLGEDDIVRIDDEYGRITKK